jgi:hypothetical protein
MRIYTKSWLQTTFLPPPDELEVMMDRAHFKEALAFCKFKIDYLQHYGKHFDQVNQPDRNEQQWIV